MSTFEDKQGALQSRIEAIDGEIGQIGEQFEQLAQQFASVDRIASLKAAAALETRLTGLRQEKALALKAQAHCTAEQLQASADEVDKQRRVVAAEARQLADGVCLLNGEIDAFLAKLRQMFERRAALLHQLAATGIANSTTVTKLQGKQAITRACCAHGLHKFIALEMVAPQSHVALATSNVLLLGVGTDHNGQAPPPTNGDGSPPTDGDVVRRRSWRTN
jgi:hypothetical protein